MSSLPRKFKCSALEWFSCPEGITPNSGLTGPNNTIYIYIYHHHHHGVPQARISLTLFRHSSLSSILLGRSSMLHPVSVQSCCRQVISGRPMLARPCEGVHTSNNIIWSYKIVAKKCSVEKNDRAGVNIYIYI